MEKLNTNINIILGSQSPRRKELLKLMGLDFKVKKINVNENFSQNLSATKAAVFLSKKKANAYTIKKNDLLICADTIVYSNKKILGKPSTKKQAATMLQALSDKKHFVVTGVTIKMINKEVSFYERSTVYFNKLSRQEITFYIENYNALDKAGGYGIQDWIGIIGIKKISGCYYNVMGLPTSLVYNQIIKIAIC